MKERAKDVVNTKIVVTWSRQGMEMESSTAQAERLDSHQQQKRHGAAVAQLKQKENVQLMINQQKCLQQIKATKLV